MLFRLESSINCQRVHGYSFINFYLSIEQVSLKRPGKLQVKKRKTFALGI